MDNMVQSRYKGEGGVYAMEKGIVQDFTFFSQTLQEDIQILVYIPANYSPLFQYHLMIAFDGKDYFQLGGIPRLANELIENHEMEQTIIVGISYKDAEDRRKKYIPTGEQHEYYLHFLAHELMPHLLDNYSLHSDPEHRALIGDSMAATVSLMAALKYPNIFGKVVLQSPYVDHVVLEMVQRAKRDDELVIYHSIGKKEIKAITPYNKREADFLTPNRELHNCFIQRSFHTYYYEVDGEHSWKTWKPQLREFLVGVFE